MSAVQIWAATLDKLHLKFLFCWEKNIGYVLFSIFVLCLLLCIIETKCTVANYAITKRCNLLELYFISGFFLNYEITVNLALWIEMFQNLVDTDRSQKVIQQHTTILLTRVLILISYISFYLKRIQVLKGCRRPNS